MRCFVFLALSLCCACTRVQTTEQKVLKSFKYSGYTWSIEQDSWGFVFAQYLEIDSLGNGRIIRQNAQNGAPRYFAFQPDSLLQNALFRHLEGETFDSLYTINRDSTPTSLYSGLYYAFDYTRSNGKRQMFQFIPRFAPRNIERLQGRLDCIIRSPDLKEIPAFDMKAYVAELTHFSLKVSPLIPPPQTVKFTPPVVVPDTAD